MRALFLPSQDDAVVNELRAKIEALGHYASVSDEDLDILREEVRKSDTVIAVGFLTIAGVYAWGFANGIGKKVVSICGVRPSIASKNISEETWLKSLPVQGALFDGVPDAC